MRKRIKQCPSICQEDNGLLTALIYIHSISSVTPGSLIQVEDFFNCIAMAPGLLKRRSGLGRGSLWQLNRLNLDGHSERKT